ncbi:MAG: hypothetical protein K8F91_11110 [Candidatus Obscuribacterales bacterium]|nr:hypothetical protein [Candidatus Obscuribacterales bacterium]
MPIDDVSDKPVVDPQATADDPLAEARNAAYAPDGTVLKGQVEKPESDPDLPPETNAGTEHMEYNRIFEGDNPTPSEVDPALAASQARLADIFGTGDPQKSLAAVDGFVDEGIESFKMTTKDGKSYSFRLENIAVDGATNKQMTHLFVTPEGGGEKVALRGVELQNPAEGGNRFDQQRNPKGEHVSFAGSGGAVMDGIKGDLDGATVTMVDKSGKEIKAQFVKGADGQIQIKMETPAPPEVKPEAAERPSLAEIDKELTEHPEKAFPKLSDPNVPPEQKIQMIDRMSRMGITHIDVKDASGKVHTFQPVVQPLEQDGVNSVQLMADGKTVMRGFTRDERVAPDYVGDQAQSYYGENKTALDFDWSNSEVTLARAPNADGSENAPVTFKVGQIENVQPQPNAETQGFNQRVLSEAASDKYASAPPWTGTQTANLFQDRAMWNRGSTAAVASILEKSGVGVTSMASATELAGQLDKLVESGQFKAGIVTDPAVLKELPPGSVVIARKEVAEGGTQWPDGKRYGSHTTLKGEGDSMFHINNRPGEDAGQWRNSPIDTALPQDKFSDYMVYVPSEAIPPEKQATDARQEAEPQVQDQNLDMASLLRHEQHGLGLSFLPPDASDSEIDASLKAKVAENKGWSVEEGGKDLEAKPGDVFAAEVDGKTRVAMARQEQDGSTGILVMTDEGKYGLGKSLEDVFPNQAENSKIRRYRYAAQEESTIEPEESTPPETETQAPAYKSLYEALDNKELRDHFGLVGLDDPADTAQELDKQLEVLASARKDLYLRQSIDPMSLDTQLANQKLPPGTLITAVDKNTGEMRVAAVGTNRELYTWATDGSMSSTGKVQEAFPGMSFDSLTMTRRRLETDPPVESQERPSDNGLGAFLSQAEVRRLYGLEWLDVGMNDPAALDRALTARAQLNVDWDRRAIKHENVGNGFDFEQYDVITAVDKDGAVKAGFYQRGTNIGYMDSNGEWKYGTFEEVFSKDQYADRVFLNRRRNLNPKS